MRSFQDLHGKEVALGRFLGRGGEGAVYSVHMRPGLVAKIYGRNPDNQLNCKLRAMVQLGTEALTSFAAWPQDLLLDRTGDVVGFLMPRVEQHHGIHALYNPTNRRTTFPYATWAFLIRAARNVAATLDTVHQHGHLIGDVNEGNVLVSQDATVRLIDCDSFQITHLGHTYPCRVGVPLYTPPELQGRRLEDVVRTPDHDRFGLAVLVFQLLFMGRHPFAGRHPGHALPIATSIRDGLFAFGQEAPGQGWEPPPSSLRLTDVSSSVAQLLERAFGKDAVTAGRRPSAVEWATALGELEAKAVICSQDPLHIKVNGSCPWCRIEKEGGPSFFLLAERRREVLETALRDPNQVLILGRNARFDEILTATQGHILSRIDGSLSARELLDLVPLESEAAERSLVELLLNGTVEFVERATNGAPVARSRSELRRREVPAAFDALAQENHFEVLGVEEDATDAEIKQAYFKQAKKYHPDHFHDPAFADVADRAEALFIRIGHAYEVLRDPKSRQRYAASLKDRIVSPRKQVIDPAENAWMAEEAIHRAEGLLHDEKAWEAVQLLGAIIPRIHDPKRRGRARVLLASAYVKNPNWVRSAEQQLQRTIQEDPPNVDAYRKLGQIYKDRGLTKRAQMMFEKALQLERRTWEARKLVEQELVTRLGTLMSKTQEAFAALESKLTAEERGQVLQAIDRATNLTGNGVEELRKCVSSLERALRLLEGPRFQH